MARAGGLAYNDAVMRVHALLLALLLILQGPVCSMNAWHAGRGNSPAPAAHDCCDGEATPAPARTDHGASPAKALACAAHCAAFAKSNAFTPTSDQTAAQPMAAVAIAHIPLPAAPGATVPFRAHVAPDRSPPLLTTPLLI